VTNGSDPAAVLRAHFGHACPEPFSLEPVRAAQINSRNWIVRRDGKPRFVLKCGPLQGIVDFYGEFSRHTPLLPAMIAFARQGSELFRLIEFREGQHWPGGGVEAARALAQLHLALRDVPGELPFSERYAPLPQAAKQRPELPGWYREIEALEALPELPRGWIHHDYHPDNVLFSGGRVTAILDMDSLITDFRMQAVAFGASRFGDAAGFIEAYAAIDPLTATELRSHAAFVRREAVRRINWILREGGNAWRGDLEKHLAVLREADGA
jgi:hypothetical protein